MAAAFLEGKVLSVHHWTDRLFSFTTTRDQALRFSNGHFTMIGLPVNGKPLLRAYSIASPNYEEHLEFLSIKVPDGPLTSRLQHIKVGDNIIIGRKPTGTLLIDYLLPGKRLYLCYRDYFINELPKNEFLGEMVTNQLKYYPTVTREPFENQGRITDLIENGKLFTDLNVPELNPEEDRVMICGSPGLLRDLKPILEKRGFNEGSTSKPGAYVVERAFVDQ